MVNYIASPSGAMKLLIWILLIWTFAGIAYADNWRASIRTALQLDNRLSSSSLWSGESLFTYAYDDAENDLHSRVNFLLRGGEHFYQRGEALYELSLEKGLDAYSTRLKAGRFERADNLGFYFLDGIQLSYEPENDRSIQLYLGKPGRIDDVRSINGDYLFGVELFNSYKITRKTNKLPTLLDIRLGWQRLKDDSVINRFNLGLNAEGSINTNAKQVEKITGQLLLSYQYEQRQFDDFLVELQVPLNKALRLRFSYEYYRPDLISNPGFREQFYSYYSLGKQKIWRTNLNYQINRELSLFLEGLHSNRETADSGMGVQLGMTIKHPFSADDDMDLSLSMDHLELGEDGLSSLYLSVNKAFNSRTNLQVDGILRRERKRLMGNNTVKGLYGNLSYMLKNNLILSLQAKLIKHSRLRDEHLLRMNVTYYFDNYKKKQVRSKYQNIMQSMEQMDG